MHPDCTAHGGSAVLIKSNIKHYETKPFRTPKIQATSVVVEDGRGHLTVTALYSPPKHVIKKEEYIDFFNTLGPRFIAGGDYNSKNTLWGSRLTTPKGRQLQAAINDLRLNTISNGEPTYWPTDPKKVPDLVDFSVVKGIPTNCFKCTSLQDLSSDHSVVLLEVTQNFACVEPSIRLHDRRTNWNMFRSIIDSEINTNLPLETERDLMEAVEHFNECVQTAAWDSTPDTKKRAERVCSKPIRELVAEKREARKLWQITRYTRDKKRLNYLSAKLKKVIQTERNGNVQNYLRNLDATAASDYSLWKATQRIKRTTTSNPPIRKKNGTWAKSDSEKGEVFASHLDNVFLPNPSETNSKELTDFHDQPYQLDLPIERINKCEVIETFKNLKQNKAPGYDLITAKILRELPETAIRFLTHLFNCILTRGIFPPQWKVAEIKMILKPGKAPEDATSYRPISLLPVLSKIMEILFLKRLNTIIVENNIIPDHQFGFRKKHGTTEQVHRLVEEIHKAFENRKYCCAAFLDISQAFDRVWHTGLLYKIKKQLPINYYIFLKSYLTDRFYRVKQGEEITKLHRAYAGVPQGSVLGPILYLVFTADLPTIDGVTIGTFADDTAALAVHEEPAQASKMLQRSLNSITKWLTTWRIKANETKSVQVTFTTRRDTCPPVKLNGVQIPQASEARYLGLYLDSRLTWRKHILTKRKALGIQLRKMYWMLSKKSQLSLKNKLLLYKCILKPIWTYGVQLWGAAANSNLEILQRFQSKMLRIVTDAPWFVTNQQLHRDLEIRTIQEEIKHSMKSYRNRLETHPNILAMHLMKNTATFKRLKRKSPRDL